LCPEESVYRVDLLESSVGDIPNPAVGDSAASTAERPLLLKEKMLLGGIGSPGLSIGSAAQLLPLSPDHLAAAKKLSSAASAGFLTANRNPGQSGIYLAI
jgi:hypothetical protein